MLSIAFVITLLILEIIVSLSNEQLRLLGKVIEVPMKYHQNKLFIQVNIGNPKQAFDVLYDTASFHLWIYNLTVHRDISNIFNPFLSKTYKPIEHEPVINTQIIRGNIVSDVVSLASSYHNDNTFNWLLINQIIKSYPFSGVLGFGMKYPGKIIASSIPSIDANPKYSLMHYLYNNGLIDRKIFAHKFISSTEAKLFIGSSGTSITNYPKCKSTINAIPKADYMWNCQFEGISFGYNTDLNIDFDNSYVIFSSNQDYLTVPDNLTAVIFPFLIKAFDVNCSNKFVYNKGISLICPNSFNISSVPDMRLKIKGTEIVIKGEDLFEPYYYDDNGKDNYGYLVRIYDDFYSKKYFIIGTIGMKYYHMVFDMEEESIGIIERVSFFNETNNLDFIKTIASTNNTNSSHLTQIIALIILLAFIVFLIMFAIKRSINQRKRHIKTNNDTSPNQIIDAIGQPMINKAV